MRSSPRQHGFTLPEALFASVVLAVAVAGIAESVVSGQMQMYDAMHARRGMMLAEELMERVLALPYADPGGGATPGPDSGETSAALFDNCDDYHGFTQATGACRDLSNTAFPGEFDPFSRSATAVYGTTTVAGLGSLTGLTVTVTVNDSQGRAWTLTRFIAQPAP